MSLDDDLGFPEEELERLFADALADHQPQKPSANAGRTKQAKKQPPPPDLDDLEVSGLDASASSGFDAVPFGRDASGKFSELDRELAMALDDDDDDDDDLETSMKRILADTLDPTELEEVGLASEIESLPLEQILGLGDDGAVEFPDDRAVELARLRARIHQLESNSALAALELRTKDDRVDTLEQQVIAATRQAAGIGREFESFRRRADRERDDLRKFAAEKVLKEFLVVFDNLGRALDHAGDDHESPLWQGVHMILGQFTSALNRCGVEEVSCDPGDQFDPQWHEAVGQEHSDLPDGSIVRRMHTGFTLNARLLRAAMVTVSRGPSVSDEEVRATEPTVPSATTEPTVPSATDEAVGAKADPLPEKEPKEKQKRVRRKKANKE